MNNLLLIVESAVRRVTRLVIWKIQMWAVRVGPRKAKVSLVNQLKVRLTSGSKKERIALCHSFSGKYPDHSRISFKIHFQRG